MFSPLLQIVRGLIWWLQNVNLTAAFSPLLQRVRDLVWCLHNVDLTLPRSRSSCRKYVIRSMFPQCQSHATAFPTVMLLDTRVMLFCLSRLLAAPMECMWSYSMPWMMTLTLPCSWRSYRMYVILFDVISDVCLTLYCWSSVHKPQPPQLLFDMAFQIT